MRNIGAGCRGAKDEAVGKLGPRERDTAPQRYARGSKLGIALKHVSRQAILFLCIAFMWNLLYCWRFFYCEVLHVALALISAFLFAVGLVIFLSSVSFEQYRRHRRPAAYLTLVAAYTVFLFAAVPWLMQWQREGNERRGQVLAEALIRYRGDRGEYPPALHKLRPDYLDDEPTYWYGLLPLRFEYEMRGEGKAPILQFLRSPTSSSYYDIEARKWIRQSS